MSWRLTITGGAHLASPIGAEPIIVEGDGPMPRLMDLDPPAEPADDGRPFVWPIQPRIMNDDPAIRASWAWTAPGTSDRYYTQQPEFANPLPYSHAYAGLTPPNPLDGLPPLHRLWAPVDGDPRTIRRILRGFRPL